MLANPRESLRSLLLPCTKARLWGAPPRNAPDNGGLGQIQFWQIFGKMDFYDNSTDEEKM
jgi:hypothetical protein